MVLGNRSSLRDILARARRFSGYWLGLSVGSRNGRKAAQWIDHNQPGLSVVPGGDQGVAFGGLQVLWQSATFLPEQMLQNAPFRVDPAGATYSQSGVGHGPQCNILRDFVSSRFCSARGASLLLLKPFWFVVGVLPRSPAFAGWQPSTPAAGRP